ncbi:MAG: proprotein convertase P-domain-containing protein [Flavobacteriales bacterium]|nr:proprotein convertase P-domain-containing protein [Flavobacteriales bacterium]
MLLRSLSFLLVLSTGALHAQEYVELRNAEVQQMVFFGETVAYRDWDSTKVFEDPVIRDANKLLVDKGRPEGYKAARLHQRVNPKAEPLGDDPAWQRLMGERNNGGDRALDLSINGQGNTGVNPADPCLDVGPNHVIQMINGSSGSYFRIYDKNGNPLGAQTYLDNFVNAIGGITTYNGAGDPIVLYDAIADRWLMSEFSSSGNRMIVAVSTTPDPTGTWYAYSFTAPSFPDYPKYGVWHNMYLITTNENAPATYALDRTRMLQGLSATAQRFTVPSYPTIGFQATTPITHDGGPAPPSNAPAMFMRMADDAWSAAIPNDRLELWTLTVNFTTPANSVLAGPTLLATQPFDTELCGYTAFACVPQPGTTTRLDPLREVIMNRAIYRNFGTHETIVCNHVTDVNNTDRHGVRWYELRRPAVASPWAIHQQGTYSPDATNRWMAGIAINANGDIAMAYNVSSSSVFPSIRYTGRLAGDPLGQMTIPETSIVAGTSRNGSNRWGDYNSLDVDPATGDFWGTAKFNTSTAWSTRIFRFSLGVPECISPQATATATCQDLSNYTLSVDLSSLGSASTVTIQVDPDGAGPLPFTTMASATSTGSYGPYGPYAEGTAVVRLLHDAFTSCNVTLPEITTVCNVPGAGCTTFNSTAPTNIVDNTTVTNSIVVPAQGGATISDLNVFVNITHTYTADLRLRLTSPQGTQVQLIASGKCGSADNIVVEFDDSGLNGLVGNTCPMANLFVIPDNALSAFNDQLFEGTWTLSVQDVATQDVGVLNNWCLIPTLNVPQVQVLPKVFLEGPLNSAGTLMSDALRTGGLVPLTEPYTALGYSFVGSSANSTSPSVLAITGNNAVVDWVVVELRSTSNPATIVASKPALLKRNGFVYEVDGLTNPTFEVPQGSYHVAVRHRNHLGTMSGEPQLLNQFAILVDFTDPSTPTFGTNAQKTVGSARALWAGDVTFNRNLLYTGADNDRDPILEAIGGTTPTNTLSGQYRQEDVNMDGVVRYTGDGNDRDPILGNIGGVVPTASRVEQLP